MSQRGRSVEPELFAMASTSSGGGAMAARPQYLSRRQMRARSAGPASSNRTSRYDDMLREDRSGSMTRSTVADRALINQHVNPYQEFPSLKRGFTLEGMPIMEKDENDGDACAYYFWAIA